MAGKIFPALWGAMAPLIVLVGCGGPDFPDTAPVTGTVTVDGEPVEDAAVMFVPEKGRPANGTTDAQGKFQLTTFEKDDGAILGKHRVAIIASKTIGAPKAEEDGTMPEMAGANIQTEWIVPQKYRDPDSSGLTKTVEEEGNAFTFDL